MRSLAALPKGDLAAIYTGVHARTRSSCQVIAYLPPTGGMQSCICVAGQPTHPDTGRGRSWSSSAFSGAPVTFGYGRDKKARPSIRWFIAPLFASAFQLVAVPLHGPWPPPTIESDGTSACVRVRVDRR